jgi:anti-repressor protein
MNQLIKINQSSINDEAVQTVNARDLHEFLEVGKKFADWIKDRISQYGFTENVDFVSFSQNRESGGKLNEYAISIDMAKELSMVERNEKGKEARKYFIECEKVAKQPPQLNDPNWLRSTLLTYSERVIELEEQVTELLPSQQALEKISIADGSLCITDAAKSLQMRPKDLFSFLQENGWIYKRAGCAHYLGYQSKTTQGLLEHKVTTVLRSDGSEKISEQVRVLPKGLAKLAKLLPPTAQAA